MNGVTLKSKLVEKGPILALLPALLVLILILVPFGYSIYFSFTDASLISKNVNFVGFDNYLQYIIICNILGVVCFGTMPRLHFPIVF